MIGKVSKYLKRTNERLVPSVHFSKQRTDSVESLVVEDDDPTDDVEELNTAPKDTRVDIIIDDVSSQNDQDNVNEEDTEPEVTKKTIRGFLKWLWAHMRIRKWVGRGLQAFGQGFMYTSPMSATVVIAQEFEKRNKSYGEGSRYHQTHVF